MENGHIFSEGVIEILTDSIDVPDTFANSLEVPEEQVPELPEAFLDGELDLLDKDDLEISEEILEAYQFDVSNTDIDDLEANVELFQWFSTYYTSALNKEEEIDVYKAEKESANPVTQFGKNLAKDFVEDSVL